MFNKGDKIICIDDSISFDKKEKIERDFANWIQKDQTYTVRDLVDNDNIVIGVLLEEVHNKPIKFLLLDRVQEPAFAEWRFSKLHQNELHESFEEKQSFKRKLEV